MCIVSHQYSTFFLSILDLKDGFQKEGVQKQEKAQDELPQLEVENEFRLADLSFLKFTVVGRPMCLDWETAAMVHTTPHVGMVPIADDKL